MEHKRESGEPMSWRLPEDATEEERENMKMQTQSVNIVRMLGSVCIVNGAKKKLCQQEKEIERKSKGAIDRRNSYYEKSRNCQNFAGFGRIL